MRDKGGEVVGDLMLNYFLEEFVPPASIRCDVWS